MRRLHAARLVAATAFAIVGLSALFAALRVLG